jgi:hypothetical protein
MTRTSSVHHRVHQARITVHRACPSPPLYPRVRDTHTHGLEARAACPLMDDQEGLKAMTDGRAPRHKGAAVETAVGAQDQSRQSADGEATKAELPKRIVTWWDSLWVVFEGEWMIGAGFAGRAEAQAWADTAEVRLPSQRHD